MIDLQTISIIIGITILAIYLICLLRIIYYEVKINKLHESMEIMISEIESKTSLLSIAQGRINGVKKEFEPKIKKLERKRRFILEKLPFIKQ